MQIRSRIGFVLSRIGQQGEPIFKRCAYIQQIARKHDLQAAETEAWIPQPAKHKQHQPDQEQIAQQGFQIIHPPQRHEGKSTEHHQSQQHEQQQTVYEVHRKTAIN